VQEIKRKTEQMRMVIKSFSINQFELQFRSIEQPLLQRFDDAKEDLVGSLMNCIKEYRQRIELATHKLEGANPTSILARGYSMVRDIETGHIVKSVKDTKPGHQLEITAASAHIIAQVTKLEGSK